MTKQVREPLPSPKNHVPDLPDDLCDVIRKMMAKSPGDRYHSYKELRQDLTNLLEGKAVSAFGFRDQSMVTAATTTEPGMVNESIKDLSSEKTIVTNPPPRRSNLPIWIAILIGVITAVVVFFVVHFARSSP
jgi:serine/threonine protein kinase